MTTLATYDKQPWESKDYDVDYSTWLGAISDELSGVVASVSVVTVDGVTPEETATLEVDEVEITATTAKVWVSGGTSGQRYKVTLRATTQGLGASYPRKDESELVFKVRDV